MMMMMMRIISREKIKPSSPTPSHLHTYNLSQLDLLKPRFYMPFVIFYRNNNDDAGLNAEQKAIMLKKSLSQSLTRYYPFSGRLPSPASTSTYVDCNDEGVLFLEARYDSDLVTFQRMMSSQEDTLDQLFADDLVFYKNTSSTNLVAVQLTHFACGGLALAISLAHVIGDVCTLGSFLRYWASVARYGSPDHKEVVPNNPHYIESPRTQSSEAAGLLMKNKIGNNKFVMRRLVFPNSKLSELKNKVVVEGIDNPTRVEVLTGLLYKTALGAACVTCSYFKPSYLFFTGNVRDNLVPKLPQSTVGNLLNVMIVKTRHTSEISITRLTAEIKKEKLLLRGIQSLQQLVESEKSFKAKLRNGDFENIYWCSSLCGFPFNQLDFGWGKPTGTTHAFKCKDNNDFVLMDTANGDGIEAVIVLEKEIMEVFENDKEMLSYCGI